MPGELNAIKREITFQQQISHPNIVQLHAYYEKSHYLYIILDYVENGNLWELMKKVHLNDFQINKIFSQIVSAICYLHKKKLIHRDIKPENILLNRNYDIKLCDFGFCAPFGDGKMRRTLCGTQEYLPPEILSKTDQSDKVDIWCMGILLYELTHKTTPFKGKNLEQQRMIQKNLNLHLKQNLNELFKEIIQECLNFDPEKRPTASEILLQLVKYQEQNDQIINNNYNPVNININNLNLNFFQNKNCEQQNQIDQQEKNYQKNQQTFRDNQYIQQEEKKEIKSNRITNVIRKITYSVPTQKYLPIQNYEKCNYMTNQTQQKNFHNIYQSGEENQIQNFKKIIQQQQSENSNEKQTRRRVISIKRTQSHEVTQKNKENIPIEYYQTSGHQKYYYQNNQPQFVQNYQNFHFQNQQQNLQQQPSQNYYVNKIPGTYYYYKQNQIEQNNKVQFIKHSYQNQIFTPIKIEKFSYPYQRPEKQNFFQSTRNIQIPQEIQQKTNFFNIYNKQLESSNKIENKFQNNSQNQNPNYIIQNKIIYQSPLKVNLAHHLKTNKQLNNSPYYQIVNNSSNVNNINSRL